MYTCTNTYTPTHTHTNTTNHSLINSHTHSHTNTHTLSISKIANCMRKQFFTRQTFAEILYKKCFCRHYDKIREEAGREGEKKGDKKVRRERRL